MIPTAAAALWRDSSVAAPALLFLLPKPAGTTPSPSKAQVKWQQALPGSLSHREDVAFLDQFFSLLNNLEINNVATGERLKSHLVSRP